jgi:ceramide glucosyltransferase
MTLHICALVSAGVFSVRNLWIVAVFSPLVYYVLCLLAAKNLRRRSWPARGFTPSVSILKPLRGVEGHEYENLASFCRQDYPAYEILCCVDDEDDPVVPVIERVIRDFPECDIRLLIGRDACGVNPKAGKLNRMVREARYGLLVSSDSDVRVEPDYLRSVAASFRDPKVGLVTSTFRGKLDGGLVSRLQLLSHVSEFWTQGITSSVIEGGMRWASGASIAISRRVLEEIGGYQSFGEFHSEDFLLARAVAARGYRVELARKPVWMIYAHQTFRAFFQREVFWSRRLRSIRPYAHFGLLATFGLLWAAIASLICGDIGLAGAIFAGYFLVRTAVILTVGLGILQDPLARRLWPLIPLWDSLAIAIWFASFATRRGKWRGREYFLQPAGRLALVENPLPARVLASGLLGGQELDARHRAPFANAAARTELCSSLSPEGDGRRRFAGYD